MLDHQHCPVQDWSGLVQALPAMQQAVSDQLQGRKLLLKPQEKQEHRLRQLAETQQRGVRQGLWQRRAAGVPPASPVADGVLAAAACEGTQVRCASSGLPAQILHSAHDSLPLHQQTAWGTVQVRQSWATVLLPVPTAGLETGPQLWLNERLAERTLEGSLRRRHCFESAMPAWSRAQALALLSCGAAKAVQEGQTGEGTLTARGAGRPGAECSEAPRR